MDNVFEGEDIIKGVEMLVNLMKESRNIVIFTGAGIDTESNIPDFRGVNGWWRGINPRLVASTHTFYENYTQFHGFYSMRLRLLEDIKPHRGHYVLAELEKLGVIKSIATQNVSGLHNMAGSKKVFELHGNIKTIICNHCRNKADLKDFLHKSTCDICGKKELRPAVILFGEALPIEEWNLAMEDIKSCDLLVVIGTSLEVYPVNQLPLMAKYKTVLINKEDVNYKHDFDIKIIGKAKEILEELNNIYNEKLKLVSIRNVVPTVKREMKGYEGLCNASDYWFHKELDKKE